VDGRTAFRALVVDDSEFARRNAAKVIAHLGGQVVGEAATGRQAVERYRALRPDLVLMDITMPEMQGMDAVEAIMKEDPAARIVMVTSVGHQEVVRRALGLGARYFLMKPLRFDEAVAALRFVLETPDSPCRNPQSAIGEAGHAR
jgi:two-component system chemotaxis response regulator CheY